MDVETKSAMEKWIFFHYYDLSRCGELQFVVRAEESQSPLAPGSYL